MIVHIAHSILAANTWTRIHAFISHARSRIQTIVIQYTFWSTTAIRIPKIFCYTNANSSVTLRIGSARRRCAWIRFRRGNNNCNKSIPRKKKIKYVTIRTTKKLLLYISDGESYVVLRNIQ